MNLHEKKHNGSHTIIHKLAPATRAVQDNNNNIRGIHNLVLLLCYFEVLFFSLTVG